MHAPSYPNETIVFTSNHTVDTLIAVISILIVLMFIGWTLRQILWTLRQLLPRVPDKLESPTGARDARDLRDDEVIV